MRRLRHALASAAAAALLAAIGLPLVWTIFSSLVPERFLFVDASIFSAPIGFDHYRALFAERTFWVPLSNSLVVATATTVLCMTLGTACAYALARLQFRWKAFVLALILVVSMFPQISIVSPLYLVLRSLRLINTYPGLILPYLTFSMPLTVWLLVGYFRQLPAEIEEAALMDGASRLGALRHVVLPMALPGLSATAILTFIYCWNEFLFALSFTLGPERYTVPVAIALFRGQYQVPWGQILAAAVVSSAPILILVLIFQRRIVQGLTSGAVKG
ncbi:MAG: carbohydrate ABC transporter permease [Acidobacteriota bacterium]